TTRTTKALRPRGFPCAAIYRWPALEPVRVRIDEPPAPSPRRARRAHAGARAATRLPRAAPIAALGWRSPGRQAARPAQPGDAPDIARDRGAVLGRAGRGDVRADRARLRLRVLALPTDALRPDRAQIRQKSPHRRVGPGPDRILPHQCLV